MAGRPRKEFQEYLTESTSSHVSHADYLESPASAFLKHSVEAKSAIDLCIRHFPKNQNETYKKDAIDSLQHLVVAVLPTVMGHFETYQRYLFAGTFDLSVFLANFDVDDFFKKLSKETNIQIDWPRLAAHRASGASSVGTLLSDSMSGWHDPERVNKYFGCFGLPYQLFTNDDKERLLTLWQLRHSIVHTGGTLTLADAQKVASLNTFGGRNISFENNFIFEVSRKLHPLVQASTNGFGSAFIGRLIGSTTEEDRQKIDKFFEVKSSVAVWLN
ncbi:hypothetical protein MPL1_03003 [Methylophaga lonarensis MPL]|uniref:RiboL-PSP-HEPN domain-containing protein n=1 Tax=Methylophaga lonarensis MPL TaxID=1286106 RepID=M7PTT5_9GAMM|nr:hypothetical protein [Methylophaga lonarensis]EMR13864.1 hypothetical protein MPL1_03003 [Methylophaga lonarensis MPL]